jgi:hypothetical protein
MEEEIENFLRNSNETSVNNNQNIPSMFENAINLDGDNRDSISSSGSEDNVEERLTDFDSGRYNEPYTTDKQCQTDKPQIENPPVYKYKESNTNFNYDEFNRRILLKLISKDPEIGEHISAMNVNINNTSREDLDYLKHIISNLEECKFNNNVEIKNCISVIKLVESVSSILVPDEFSDIKKDLENVRETIENYDYNLSLITELSSQNISELHFKRVKPFSRMSTLLVQSALFLAMKKIPTVVQKVVNKVQQKRKHEDEKEADSKKRKIN